MLQTYLNNQKQTRGLPPYGGGGGGGGGGAITAPGQPKVVQSAPTSQLLRWARSTVTTGELFDLYDIYRATAAGGPWTKVGSSHTPRFVATGLANSTQYFYKIKALDEAGTASADSAVSAGASTTAAGARAELPQPPALFFNTRFQLPTGGTTWTPTTATQLQAAIDGAALGDVIVLNKSLTYDLNTAPGNHITLKNKVSGSGWIYIISSDLAGLPAPGTRMSPANWGSMPTVIYNTTNTGQKGIEGEANAHHYRFEGIRFKCSGASAAGVFRPFILGYENENHALDCHHMIVSRCTFEADPVYGGRKALVLAANYSAVLDCYSRGWYDKAGGAESQGMWIDYADGPFKIRNCDIEGGCENIMTGNGTATTPRIPADISIYECYMRKDLAWLLDATYGKTVSKNFFECKVGARIAIEDCTFENEWYGGQPYTTSFKSTGYAWCKASDIRVMYNRFKNIGGKTGFIGSNGGIELPTERTMVRDNVYEITQLDQNGTNTGGDGIPLFVGSNPLDSVYRHNTVISYTKANYGTFSLDNSVKGGKLDCGGNIVVNSNFGYCIKDNGTLGGNVGQQALIDNFASYIFDKNVIVGGDFTNMPAGNFNPANLAAVQFAAGALASPPVLTSGYALNVGSPYKAAGEYGEDLGADVAGFIV